MISGVKPYPAYTDSGVEWVGHLPDHWAVQPSKSLLRSVTGGSWGSDPGSDAVDALCIRGTDFNHLRLTADITKAPTRSFSENDIRRRSLHRGDLVISTSGGNSAQAVGAVVQYLADDVALPTNFAARLSPMPNVDSRFLTYLYYSMNKRGLTKRLTNQVTIANLDVAQYLRIPVPLPPLDEQTAIARFLDSADLRIRRYIAAKKKLILLLSEQKQAIVHRAVTQGIDAIVRAKPSGVEWLGDVPEHWSVLPFTRCAIEIADYRGATPTKTESGVFLVTARNVRKGRIDYDISREFVAEEDYATVMRRGLPQIGDLLLTMEAPLGNAALIDRVDVALAQRVVRFRFASDRFLPRFVLHSVLSPYFQNQLLRRGTGSTAIGIKASKLPQLRLLCPPFKEQEAIVALIDDECMPLDRAMERTQLEIDLVREYLVRLIADVVTGKVDVREAAARLPGESEPLERMDALADRDEPEGEGNADAASFEDEL